MRRRASIFHLTGGTLSGGRSPFRYAGRQVEVEPEPDRVRFYHAGRLIGTHPRCPGSYQLRMDRAHYAGILDRPNAVVVPEEVEIRDLSFYESLVEGGVQ